MHSIILMVIFHVIGAILIAFPEQPRVFGGIDLPTLLVGYFGYVYVVAACVYFVKTGK